MTNDVQCICDDNGIELLVNFDYGKTASQVEECHGLHELGRGVEFLINSVELVIAGKGIDIVKQLTLKQLQHLSSKIILD